MVARRPGGSYGATPSSIDAAQSQVVVPQVNLDPIWSLQPWPVTVTIGGQDIEIPALPAVEWLAYLMRPEPDVDGLILDLLPEVDELLFQERTNVEDVYEMILELIATVCARTWWVALRQISIARESWHILGPQMLEVVDASQVSIAAWLDVLLLKTLSSMDPKDTTMFSSRLEAPPPSVTATKEPMEEMEMDRGAFLSMS